MSPRPQPDHVDVTAYVVVEPKWSPFAKDDGGRPVLEGGKIAKTTQTRPQSVRGDSLVTRITLRIDAAALLPLQPQAIVHIGANDVEVIHVDAENPGEPTDG